MKISQQAGRVAKAPEHFLTPQQIAEVQGGRRDFLRGAFASAASAVAAASGANAVAAPSASGSASAPKGEPNRRGDANILELPEHSTGLGQPVAALGYGVPSKWEKNLQRRESPGLTRVSAASVSFCPLQGLFGIITPSGLHFERHHQGWWDIDPSKHRFMING
jgi:sulfane dehydrogenase subunit SoxC